MTVGLVYAEMQAAALAVSDAVEPLQSTLSTLGSDIETAATGFKGQAAAGFAEAINAWFDVAVTIGPILDGYSQALIGLAQEHAINDQQVADNTGRLQGRLGGGPL